MKQLLLTALILLLPGGAPLAQLGEVRRACLRIDRVTAFAPRGEIYVEVQASCGEDDFELEDPIVAYLEILLSDLPPVSQDVRVHSSDSRRRDTVVFQDLSIATGDPILIRLIRFGEILSLQSIKVP